MKKSDRTRKSKKPSHVKPLPGEITPEQRKQNANALHQADKDMGSDPEFAKAGKSDDLDEGEIARLGDDKNDLV